MALPISVVIPYHNSPEMLPQALASVRAQTAHPEEVIVVDDGSEPAAGEVLASLGSAAGDVRLITLPENRGPGPARNAGVAAATQPYVAFLDVDDMWAGEKLEVQYAFMRAWPELDATHTEVTFFFADGSELRRDPGPRELSMVTALSNHVMITPSILIKKESFHRIGGFDAAFRCAQDWEMQIRMAKAGFRIQYMPEVLTRVRREDHGNHSSNWRCYLAGHLRILWKHRDAYHARDGRRFWIHRLAYECWRAGHRTEGVIALALKLPYRIGV